MKHPWEPIIIAFAQDTSVGVERRINGLGWRVSCLDEVIRFPDGLYRLKPAMRSVTLADGTVVSWPEPMRVAPEYEQFFIAGYERVAESNWSGHAWQQRVLKAGFCHATEEAARQHRKALVLANGGEL